ncbi:MAG: hypothetical protein H6568_14850 [Lewinellaceae bacterium]|nr:hypothetical protein [Saprospiraceae bacterium]MCB9314035.1 hypothetical protein [Lewinellaceae bacterium]
MRRILLGATLLCLAVLSGQSQDQLISRWVFTGNTTFPDSVHQSIRSSAVRLSPVLPTDCPSCPFVPGAPPSLLPGYGTYGWPDSTTPDTSRYLEIPVFVQPGWRLDMSRLSFETHRESQAASKWQIRYSMNNFSSPLASGVMGSPNSWSTVTIPLTSILQLQDLTDTVFFRIYPFDAKKGPNEMNNTIWRVDSIRIYSAGAPLPVELTRFTAEPDGADIRLQWSTATEINSATFGIEHALDGQPFRELDRVPAAGWSVALQSYQRIHRAAGPGQHYYRLRMIDLDGQEAFSPVVNSRILPETSGAVNGWIAHDQAFIQGISNPLGGILQLHDLQGRMVTSRDIPAGNVTPQLTIERRSNQVYLLSWHPLGGDSIQVKVFNTGQ